MEWWVWGLIAGYVVVGLAVATFIASQGPANNSWTDWQDDWVLTAMGAGFFGLMWPIALLMFAPFAITILLGLIPVLLAKKIRNRR